MTCLKDTTERLDPGSRTTRRYYCFAKTSAIGGGGLPSKWPLTDSVFDAKAYVPVNVPSGRGSIMVIVSCETPYGPANVTGTGGMPLIVALKLSGVPMVKVRVPVTPCAGPNAGSVSWQNETSV